MMWSWEKKCDDNAEKNLRLNIELTEKCNEIAVLKSKISKLSSPARSATFFFDFSAVKAFSVERNLDDKDLPVTIIGYLLPEPVVTTEGSTTTKDVVHEWYLHCDEKQHEAIVKLFKESIK